MARRAATWVWLLCLLVAGCATSAPASSGVAPSRTEAPSSPSAIPFQGAAGNDPVSVVGPGTELLVQEGVHDCTAGFLVRTREVAPQRTFLATAGHCFFDGTPEDPVTCASSLPPLDGPLGNVSARLAGGDRRIGRFAYVSFAAMHARGESDAYACYYNDFGLVELDPGIQGTSRFPNGTVPAAVLPDLVPPGAKVQAITFVPGRTTLTGVVVPGPSDRSPMLTATFNEPCRPGDSGAPVLGPGLSVVGVVLTQPADAPRSCGVGMLAPLLAYAESTMGVRLELVP